MSLQGFSKSLNDSNFEDIGVTFLFWMVNLKMFSKCIFQILVYDFLFMNLATIMSRKSTFHIIGSSYVTFFTYFAGSLINHPRLPMTATLNPKLTQYTVGLASRLPKIEVGSIHQTSPIPKEYAHWQRQSQFRKLCRGKSSVEVN